MNALARALKAQAPKDSGSLRRDRFVRASFVTIASPLLVPPTSTVQAEFVRTAGGVEATFTTQRLTLDQKSWAASNLDQVIGGAVVSPGTEELAAAKRAVANLALRDGEDDRKWAKELGEQFGSYTD